MALDLAHIGQAFAETGLALRGAAHLPADGPLAAPMADGSPAATVVLVGNFGAALWPRFSAGRRNEPHPLDSWTRRTVAPLALRLGARDVYPSDRPYLPFQQWAMAADDVTVSPLGMLIHPTHGLDHAYRAALLLADRLVLPEVVRCPPPCAACATRPCLSTCPVGAFSVTGYDVPRCAAFLLSAAGSGCLEAGCAARNACPVARDSRYPVAQTRFHIAAFLAARRAR